MKILTIGGAIRDVFVQCEESKEMHIQKEEGKQAFFFLVGSKIDVTHLTYHSGGGATNTAVSFKRLGFEVSAFFKTGNDHDREIILEELAEEHVDTHLALVDAVQKTGVSLIMPSPNGDSTVLTYRGANAHVQIDEIPFKEISLVDCLYITSLSGESAQLLPAITSYAKKNKVSVAVNPGGSQLNTDAAWLSKALGSIDTLILNSHEATILMHSLAQRPDFMPQHSTKITQHHGQEIPALLKTSFSHQDFSFSITAFFQEVLRSGPRVVVVTNGAEGVYVATPECIYFHPSLPIKPVSTVGAGDAFGSCFIATLLQGRSVPESMVCGIINSASVLGFMSAKQGLLSQAQVDERIKNVAEGLLQTFFYDL